MSTFAPAVFSTDVRDVMAAENPRVDERNGLEAQHSSQLDVSYQATRVTFFHERQDWLVQAYKQLSRLAQLEDDWDTYGAEAPAAEALVNARSVLSTLAELDFQPTSVDASAEGGVCLSFRVGDRYGDVECFNSGEVLAVTSAGGDETQVWTVADLDRDLRASLTKIRTFLGR